MSTRNLDYLFKPRSVALIGASKRSGAIGSVVSQNLFQGGFEGPIMPVNPKHRFIRGVVTYPDVESLPETPDLAVIATPPETVPGIIDQLGRRGTPAAVVISAGFGELPGSDGVALQQAMLDAARPHTLRIVGPNCLGMLLPGIDLNASFAHRAPDAGSLAFIAQSGAIVTSIIDWAHDRGIGFSHLFSLGDMADVDFSDLLDYLANVREARAILLYIESIRDARRFMSAARAAARMKPVIVVKAGRHPAGAKAAASHTGALAGSDAVYDAAFRRAGMLRVYSLQELFDAAETLAMGCRPEGDRLAIMTNGGGIGVLAADAVIDAGGRLAELPRETVAELDRLLPPTWSHQNPIDLIGDADGERYAATLKVLAKASAVDGILVLNCPTAVASSTDAAESVIKSFKENPRLPLLSSWVGEGSAAKARALFAQHHIPSYATPEQAVRAFMHMVNYRRNQEMLIETPPSIPESFATDTAKARAIIEQALDESREVLSEPEAKAVLSAYGIPVVSTQLAQTADEAGALAAGLGGAVVLKVVSPQIIHKSDAGGVIMDLSGAASVRETAQAMARRIAEAYPQAHILGFSIQPMIRRPGAHELIIGATEDPQFGPTLLFGQGGTAVEVVKDRALALPPLNMRLAHEVIAQTRIYDLLRGYRGTPAANLDAIALTLIKVSQLLIDLPEIKDIDINPLLADAHGVVALDARMRVARASEAGTERLAIRPYPKELEEQIPLGDGRTLLLRPILPEDEPSLQAAFTKLTPEEVRFRFFIPMKTLSHVAAVRFTQIDYDREMGLILTEIGIPGKTEIFGVVNIVADPDNEEAEYAIIVRHDMTALGLGIFLMRRIIEYARRRGIKRIHGDVLHENRQMLKLCQVLGFTEAREVDDPGLVRVRLEL
ncbi:MAG: bifunctional acetate--CoA ligase family protein/GNAT family N-acetyltransferase [Candidatus Thiodiazotropha sp.]